MCQTSKNKINMTFNFDIDYLSKLLPGRIRHCFPFFNVGDCSRAWFPGHTQKSMFHHQGWLYKANLVQFEDTLLESSFTSLCSTLNLLCHSKIHVSHIVLSPYTCWSISSVCNGVFSNQTKNFRFIHGSLFIICSSVLINEQHKKECKKKMQWLLKAKIIIIYSQNIMLHDNRICLSLFHL